MHGEVKKGGRAAPGPGKEFALFSRCCEKPLGGLTWMSLALMCILKGLLRILLF